MLASAGAFLAEGAARAHSFRQFELLRKRSVFGSRGNGCARSAQRGVHAALDVLKTLERGAANSLLNQPGNIELGFGFLEFFRLGEQRGNARQENGAAIVERFGGNIVRADFARRGE